MRLVIQCCLLRMGRILAVGDNNFCDKNGEIVWWAIQICVLRETIIYAVGETVLCAETGAT